MPVVDSPRSKNKPFTPAYRRIESDLRRKISSGDWKVGSMMPSRRDLAGRYGVDVNTVQRAIKSLLDDGLLRAEGWRGTFVGSVPDAGSTREETTKSSTAHAVIGVTSYALTGSDLGTVTEDWQMTILRGIETTVAHDQSATLFFENRRIHGKPDLISIRQVIDKLLSEGAQALIIVFPRDNEINEILSAIDITRIPTILILPDMIKGLVVPSIGYDNTHGGYLAAHHMIKQGYSDLAFLSPFQTRWSAERLVGVRNAISQQGFSPDSLILSECDCTLRPGIGADQEQYGYDYGKRLLMQSSSPRRGIVAVNDNISYGLLQAAQEMGRAVGRDFGLVSFDDNNRSRNIGLSSLHPPLNEMGSQAAKWIMHGLLGEKFLCKYLFNRIWYRENRVLCRPPTGFREGGYHDKLT